MKSTTLKRNKLNFLTLPYQFDSTRITLRRYDPTNRYCAMISNHGNAWIWAKGRLYILRSQITSNPGIAKRYKDGRSYKLIKTGDFRYISDNGKNKFEYLHRCVAKIWIRVPRKLARLGVKLQIDHRNGDRYDNRPQNLRWCTASQNMRYSNRARKGLPV